MGPVMLLSYSGALGGAERALLDFTAQIDGELCLACPKGALAAAARVRGVRVFPIRAHSLELRASIADRVLAPARQAAHALAVRRLARDLRPSLVIANGMRAALGAPRPFVFVHHDMLPGPLIGSLVRAAAREAALVVVPSRAVADDLGVPAVVIAPGVDLARFGERNGHREPVVLTLGAIVPWKRPELALEAVAIARRVRPELRLRLVGAPLGVAGEALRERLAARASEPDLAGAVDLVGAVEDPSDELTGAACLLHCAPREPFGIALVEAMAAGCPVVAPAAAGPLEIVDRSCGVLYAPGDAGEAASAILRAAGDAALGAGARAVAKRRFDGREASERFATTVAPIRATRAGAPLGTSSLALVTVTHNSAAELGALLRSAATHLPGARVVVVDSASSDDTVAVARAGCEGLSVELIALDRNAGFGAACNEGVRSVEAPVTALLNPDVELIDDSLLSLAAQALRAKRLLAPLVLSPDGSRQQTVHPLPASAADLARALVPPAAVPGPAGVALAPWRSSRPRRVGWAVACALVAPTELLRRLGPFDERIFLYGEDLDLGLRARDAGVPTWFCPETRVVHHGGHTTTRAFGGEPFERLARARDEVVAQRLGNRRAAVDRAAQAVTFGSRIAVKRALGRPVRRERSQLHAVRTLGRSA